MTPMLTWVLAIVALTAFAAHPATAQGKKEQQSAFGDNGGTVISSSAFIKLLNEKLDGKYQDLELVFATCQSGEWASRSAGLKGSRSVSTSTDEKHLCEDSAHAKGTTIGGIAGLDLGAKTFHGYMAQYVKKLLADKNTVGNKALHDAAEANRAVKGDDPKYASSGAAADAMTLHGGKKSNHAIVFAAAGFIALNDALVDALKGAGYTDDTITYLGSSVKATGGNATKAELEKAIDKLRVDLDKNPGEEKAYIFVTAHGSYEERTVAYRIGQFEQPGGGVIVSSTNRVVDVTVDDPITIASLQDGLRQAGGGVWGSLPEIQRAGPAYLSFTTAEELFELPRLVGISLNDLSLGALLIGGNPTGVDYQITIPDDLLDQVMPDILADGFLRLAFDMLGGESFRFAVPEDARLGGDGIRIGVLMAPAVSEPGAFALLAVAAIALSAAVRISAWRAAK